ncbi:hypothetical protein F5Y11DRAFT_310137 [Daldinia sp. FL1419]|nr:hypothetical protein F5Y11DRAFT_310137 [Daldinia sp. FL1419]
MGLSRDWWGLGIVLVLAASRLCDIIVIRRRAKTEWFGKREPPCSTEDLFVLLSQDRWIRIKGKLNHVKAVTSGQWLRDEDRAESWFTATATLAVYLATSV